MRKLIMVLSVAVFGFAGWTVWNDPTIGPSVQAMVPKSIDTASITASIREAAGITTGRSSGSSGGGGSGATGTYGGIGAASRVMGALPGAN